MSFDKGWLHDDRRRSLRIASLLNSFDRLPPSKWHLPCRNSVIQIESSICWKVGLITYRRWSFRHGRHRTVLPWISVIVRCRSALIVNIQLIFKIGGKAIGITWTSFRFLVKHRRRIGRSTNLRSELSPAGRPSRRKKRTRDSTPHTFVLLTLRSTERNPFLHELVYHRCCRKYNRFTNWIVRHHPPET